jgi:hypothetical protein
MRIIIISPDKSIISHDKSIISPEHDCCVEGVLVKPSSRQSTFGHKSTVAGLFFEKSNIHWMKILEADSPVNF